jgi:hypothetical protein
MTIHEKLVAIQSDLKAPKSQVNTFGKYKYRSCEDILEAIKPLLKEHSLVLTISDQIIEVGGRVYVCANAKLSDGESSITTSAYAREQEAKLNKEGRETMDHAQITGSTSSYARKYALNGLFCIDDTKDADATNDHDMAKNVKKAFTEPRPAPLSKDIIEINSLCVETGTDKQKLYEFYKIVDQPTPEQSKAMILSLKKKLSKIIDSNS